MQKIIPRLPLEKLNFRSEFPTYRSQLSSTDRSLVNSNESKKLKGKHFKRQNSKRDLPSSGSENSIFDPDVKHVSRQNSRRDLPSSSDPLQESGFDTDRNLSTTRKLSRRQSRSDVLLGALKRDLKTIESNPAINRHRKRVISENNDIQEDENIRDTLSRMSWPYDKRNRRRYSSIGAFTSRRSRRHSSVGSENDFILSESELRKINMLQTLQNMGMTFPKRRSKLVQSPTWNEVDVLENMHIRRKQSLSSRMLEATKLVETRRISPKPMENVIREVTEVTDMVTASSSDETSRRRPSRPSSIESGGNETVKSLPRSRYRASIAGSSIEASAGAFKRRIRKRKVRPFQKFKRFAKFLVILLRAWRAHSQSVHEILLSFDNLDAVTRSDKEKLDLLFDISEYRASKEAKISKDFKRILCKKPADRTPEEIHYVQVALRNYKSIVEYPVHMQKMLAERAWYESYDAKRIIVREGHVPMCFYFILNGSGVVSAMDRRTNTRKTVMYLVKGDSFGEQAIMTRSLRQTTVISREKIELLTVSDTDFVDIFMSGGLRDSNDPFIRSIGFLKEWPIEKLAENPKKAIFSYFKRKTVLVADSQKNDWIFIIKSGSCTILKQMEQARPRKQNVKASKPKTWREKVEGAVNQDQYLSHDEQLAMMCEIEIKRLEEQNSNIHYYALPEINIATNAAYTELREEHERILEQSEVSRALHDLESLGIEDDKATSISGLVPPPKPQKRRMSINELGNMLKPAHMTRPGPTPSTEKPETTYYGTATQEDEEQRPASSETRKDESEEEKNVKQTIFVNVQNLTKGQVFGLQDIVFENQTSLSLISNGAEVIMINKKFFYDQLTTPQFVRLREKIFPYPSEEQLNQELADMVTWDYHKNVTFLNSLRNAAIRKQNIHDARSHLAIPPVAV